MCDIGRFDYHWIESDARLRRPLVRAADGLQPAAWHEAMPRLIEALGQAGRANPTGVRFLLSAHASNEELFLFNRLAEELIGDSPASEPAISVAWTVTHKPQPERTTFKVPATDAPNVTGARLLGLVPPAPADTSDPLPDLGALRSAVEGGRVSALYVFDPGPDGSLGDTTWIRDARRSGRLPLLIVQGVLMTALAESADFVLPGASSSEKEASYVNGQGRVQGTARAIPRVGEARDDSDILIDLARDLGVAGMGFDRAADVRAAIADRYPHVEAFAGLANLTFAPATSARSWLQTSNPSERWKWDFMFQDLPPVKGAVDSLALPPPPGVIPLREVK
jgi:NADH-quinone oxidoreductase subunit G